ncbi:MAG: HlyC/CorC family transporter [Limnochordales bacterium]|nr:HlyC/CorC family transporter [Limnochordales bacterium]
MLVILNGFFVVAEFSLVKMKGSRLHDLAETGSGRARAVQRVVENLQFFLPAIQLGITVASLALGWIGLPALAEWIRSLFAPWQTGSGAVWHWIVAVLAFGLLAFLHVLAGELVPKSLAIRAAERGALWTAPVLLALYYLTFPFLWLFHKGVTRVLRLFGLTVASEADLARSEEELRDLVSSSHEQGVLDAVERDLLVNVFDLSERVAKEVMIPRQDMVCIFTDQTLGEIMQTIRSSGHTRYPLCEGDRDHIIGLVHVRDLIGLSVQPGVSSERRLSDLPDWRRITHEVLMIPEGTSVTRLLKEMQRRRTHMAIVLDEYGGTAGLITMEDIVEEIVGEIYDEFDKEPPKVQPRGANAYELDGSLLLEDVAELLNTRLEDPDVETVGGFVFNRLGRKPKRGDMIVHEQYRFQVLEVKGARIVRLLVEPLVVEAPPAGAAKAGPGKRSGGEEARQEVAAEASPVRTLNRRRADATG